ncbi:MAG TPA: type IV pilin N-terminal domain-containing protein [Methanocorpusculum sp.]|nr:type IV pilin N-terminal domain-containing protein [Methanocorpusculum sp.]
MYQKHTNKKEAAVSPVVGVMLMLVVTIIIAGVVAVFAGNMGSDTKAAPVLTLDTKMVNGGEYYNSYLQMEVLSVSEPIKTSDLKITTKWYDSENSKWVSTSTGEHPSTWDFKGKNMTASPFGYGNGIAKQNSGIPTNSEQQFGNYTLIGGTVMYAYPAGQKGGFINKADSVEDGYTSGGYVGKFASDDEYDGMQSVLGKGWEELKTGSTVNIVILHLPSNQIIYDKDITVS